jgi:hypothetical protein
MPIAVPLSGANAVGIGRAARPALPSCREPHDLPYAPLSSEEFEQKKKSLLNL